MGRAFALQCFSKAAHCIASGAKIPKAGTNIPNSASEQVDVSGVVNASGHALKRQLRPLKTNL